MSTGVQCLTGDVLSAMVYTRATNAQVEQPSASAEPSHVCYSVPHQLFLGTQTLLDLPCTLRGDPRYSDRSQHGHLSLAAVQL